MSSPERTAWNALRPVLQGGGLDPVRIENTTSRGVPDVNYLHGWVELKAARTWPRRLGVSLALPHFTPVQRIWLERRWRAGGLAWALLRVGDGLGSEWVLLDGVTAAQRLGRADRDGLLYNCAWWGTNPVQALPWLRGEPVHRASQALLCRLRCARTREEVCRDLGWLQDRLFNTERGVGQEFDELTLLDYWRS